LNIERGLWFQLLLSGTVPATKFIQGTLHNEVLPESTGPLWAHLRAIIQAAGCIEIPTPVVAQVLEHSLGTSNAATCVIYVNSEAACLAHFPCGAEGNGRREGRNSCDTAVYHYSYRIWYDTTLDRTRDKIYSGSLGHLKYKLVVSSGLE
jgi:hypothetical protein